jgi:hypothetical protein
MEKLDRLEQLRLKLRKRFPATKDMTEKQLKKEIKSNKGLQKIMLLGSLLYTSFLIFIPFNQLDAFQKLTVLGVIVGGIALSFAFYSQYRCDELEASFELRLREAIANTKPQS